MKRTLSLFVLAASAATLPAAALSTTSADAAAVQAPARDTTQCHSRNYQPGNCKHIPKGQFGSVRIAGPTSRDAKSVLYVPATKHGREVTVNQVTSPNKVGHAATSYTVSAVDPITSTIKRQYVPRMTLKVDSKYTACTYNLSLGTCAPLKLAHGTYSINGPGTFVLMLKHYMVPKASK
jgi:hypothetical protein